VKITNILTTSFKHISRIFTRFKGLNMEGEYYWNFAYGANLSMKAIKRRRLNPLEVVPCVLKGYELSFDMIGVTYIEPAFGTLRF